MNSWFRDVRDWLHRRHPVLLALITVIMAILATMVLLSQRGQVILYEAF